MRFIVTGTGSQLEILKKNSDATVEWNLADKFDPAADAWFYLSDHKLDLSIFPAGKPVFINSVVHTLEELSAPANIYRINGWKSFLERPIWELAGTDRDLLNPIFQAMGKQFKVVTDEPGFIAARVISMIINEAYFALEENVSTKTEIDTAMKLGTNYPYGPFEWSEIIGLPNVYALLQCLAKTDNRFSPAALLAREALLV